MSELDAIFAPVLAFIFIMALIVISLASNSIYNTVSNVSALNASQNISALRTVNNEFNQTDQLIAFVIISFYLIAIIAAFMVPSHPVFFAMFLILEMIAIIIGGQISNAFQTINSISTIQTQTNNWPLSTALMGFLPLPGLFCSIVIGIVMMIQRRSLPRQGGGLTEL